MYCTQNMHLIPTTKSVNSIYLEVKFLYHYFPVWVLLSSSYIIMWCEESYIRCHFNNYLLNSSKKMLLALS